MVCCQPLAVFLNKTIRLTTDRAQNDYIYFWDDWQKPVESLMNLSEGLGQDTKELQRAHNAMLEAQLQLKKARDMQVNQLKRMHVDCSLNDILQVKMHS